MLYNQTWSWSLAATKKGLVSLSGALLHFTICWLFPLVLVSFTRSILSILAELFSTQMACSILTV
uniref:ACOC n=1 Tax=Arundo donax TaxID=35708 RepID=A0A0A9EYS6_ARUDO